MNTIIELNGTSVDLRTIKAVAFREQPMLSKRNYNVELDFLSEEKYVFNPNTGCHDLISPRLNISYPSYGSAARGHSVLIRAWSRYRTWDGQQQLLKTVEQELGIAS
jgi:hypothetical protein